MPLCIMYVYYAIPRVDYEYTERNTSVRVRVRYTEYISNTRYADAHRRQGIQGCKITRVRV